MTKTNNKKRTGRLSKEERDLIKRLAKDLPVRDIADQLNRSYDAINEFVKKELSIGVSTKEVAEYSLENRAYWPQIISQFTEQELKIFKYHWSEIMAQFKNDVFSTEEMQVVDACKLELLMNRNLSQNKDNIEQINTYNQMLRDERSRDKDQQDIDYIINMERQVASLKASQESLNRDYRELQAKKASMLREMKGTREQRIKRLEDSKQSFTSWVASLMQDPERMKKYGIEMEKMRAAMKKEEERLSSFHKYEDGTVDQPFLTPDTVKD